MSHSVAFTKALNSPAPNPDYKGFKIVAAYPKGSNDIKSSVDSRRDFKKKAVTGEACDVDSRAEAVCSGSIEKMQNTRPAAMPDFRKTLESKDLDILVIAAPDHWQAPAAILASKAGKNIYLEKPCSHNPNEGEILIAASKKYKNVIQTGNQRRRCKFISKSIICYGY